MLTSSNALNNECVNVLISHAQVFFFGTTEILGTTFEFLTSLSLSLLASLLIMCYVLIYAV